MDTELTGTLARLLLALVLSLTAPVLRAETLIAIDNANPPFMYQQNGQARGLYPLVLQAVFARAGQPVAIQAMPWKRALRRSENAEVGVGGIYKTSRRLALYDYSQPIFEEKLIVYVHRDKAFRFTRVDDLNDKRIGVIRGWSYTEAFDEAIRDGSIKVSESSSDEANFKMLVSGRLDAVIAIELAGQRIIQQLQLRQVLALTPPLGINPTYLVFAKQAKQKALLQRFDRILLEMRADGSLDRLVQQAIGSE